MYCSIGHVMNLSQHLKNGAETKTASNRFALSGLMIMLRFVVRRADIGSRGCTARAPIPVNSQGRNAQRLKVKGKLRH
jgi:hypothetical protein